MFTDLVVLFCVALLNDPVLFAITEKVLVVSAVTFARSPVITPVLLAIANPVGKLVAEYVTVSPSGSVAVVIGMLNPVLACASTVRKVVLLAKVHVG